jgi:hypothetical protein
MKIQINGADVDIRPETEKNVGEILCGLESWLTESGFRMTGISIDGEPMNAESMESCFAKTIDTIATLDIKTSPLADLIGESIVHMIDDIAVFEEADFEEKNRFAQDWQKSPQAGLLAEQSPDMFSWTVKTFSGEGSGTQALRLIAKERLRELEDTKGELGRTETLVSDVCARLEEFPLDIQMGKDSRAAETVKAFSGIAEKLFRIFDILKMKGFPIEEITVKELPISAYLSSFNAMLKDMLAAYGQSDTVLAGDIAEYEMAPRLRELHFVVNNAVERRSE